MIRLFSVRLHCPACGHPHEFKMDEALGMPDGNKPAKPPQRTDGKASSSADCEPRSR
jgi:hypothetical protein